MLGGRNPALGQLPEVNLIFANVPWEIEGLRVFEPGRNGAQYIVLSDGISPFVLVLYASSFPVQVIVAGKLRAQRAKAMKFRDGYMIKSGRVREGESPYGSRRSWCSAMDSVCM